MESNFVLANSKLGRLHICTVVNRDNNAHHKGVNMQFPHRKNECPLDCTFDLAGNKYHAEAKTLFRTVKGEMEREVSVTPSVSLAPEWPEPLRKLAKSAAMLRSGGGGGVVAPKLQYMEEREVKFYKNYYVAHTSVHLVKTVTSHICRVSLGFSKLRYQSK